MKNLYKAAIVAALGLASISAKANNGDILLGFTGGSQDYIVDLGAIGGSTVDLTSSITQSLLTASGALNFGALGGDGNTATVWVGGLTTSGASLSGVAGLKNVTQAAANQVVGIGNFYGLSAGVGALATPSDATSYSTVAANVFTANSINASAVAINANGVTSVDLFQGVATRFGAGTKSNPYYTSAVFSDLGTLSLTEVGGQVTSLTFTSNAVSVPEPTSIAAFGGAGLLLLSLRNKFRKA